ncbi:uncharacterized protein LOC143285140 [Babylonia areolata]|uniref:uncharacterized protein LOC143285140 n=1 Tax=Babylonia areolata TaxID=304850 RepID=UPI003FD1A161
MATTASHVLLSILLSWLALVFTGVAADDVCSYTRYEYSARTGRYERNVSFQTCQWGCCWKYAPPCCSPPVGLIVGCVIGGLVGLIVLVGCLCCCYSCCCRSDDSGSARSPRGGVVVRYPNDHHPGGGGAVHFTPGAGALNEPTISTSLPPGVYQPPPSYEEVMAGEINPAFKADS